MADPHRAAREGEGEVATVPTSHQSISSQRAALGQQHLQPLGTREMQILRPHPRQTEPEAQGWGSGGTGFVFNHAPPGEAR